MIPNTRESVEVGSTQKCPKKNRFTARVQAQGTDCGGLPGSTIAIPALVKTIPVTIAEGFLLSTGTWGLLNKTQRKIRQRAKVKLEAYITDSPLNGGRLEEKTFMADDSTGGKRYDVDTYGGRSFLT